MMVKEISNVSNVMRNALHARGPHSLTVKFVPKEELEESMEIAFVMVTLLKKMERVFVNRPILTTKVIAFYF